jgi:hypothetical protein
MKSYIDDADNPKKNNDSERCRFDISEYVLVLFALIFLTKNSNATHRIKSKVLEFLKLIDEEQYSNNQDVVWRILLARGIGKAVIVNNARTITAIEHRVLEDTDWADYHAAFFEAYKNNIGHVVDGEILENELCDEDVQFIENYISTRLRFSYLWKSKNFFREMADRIDAGDMGDISIFNDRVMTVMERLVQKGRQSRAMIAQESQDFNTDDSSFEAAIRAAHAARNKPQSNVKTGVKLLNEMLGGGYEGSRVYIHFGRSGDWKSGALCSAAFWACDPRFNPKYETKDPTRKPAVLFVSGENDVFETIERMLSFALGSHIDLANVDVDKIVKMLEVAFSSESCKFIFKYRASRSITTSDLESMIHDLYLQGYEVILVVHDYIKRIKSIEQFKERHLELGAIVDEESAIAKRHNIPVITGMQLNRDAYAKFDAAIKSGKMDAIKELGTSNVGESVNVFENADCVIFQGRVYSEAIQKLFLTVRLAKMRGKRKSKLDFFAQPFDLDENGDINEMKLCEDMHLPDKQCKGSKELGDGLSKEYDPNENKNSKMDQAAGILKQAPLPAKNKGAVVKTAPISKKEVNEEPPIIDDEYGLAGL